MTFHTTIRVPVDDSYAALLGKAVYVFAYYEWTIIYIIESLKNGFLNQYCRNSSMTSGGVCNELQNTIDSLHVFVKISKPELQKCCDDFKELIIKRNALIHAHPVTDSDGSQILAYQTMAKKPIPDMKWPKSEIVAIIQKFDEAACSTGALFDRLR